MGDEQGHEVLVPTIVDGKFLTPDGKMPAGPVPHSRADWEKASPEWKSLRDKSWAHFKETGQNLGKFDNADDADAYANALHNRGEAKSAAKGGISKPPTAPAKTGSTRMAAPPKAPTLVDAQRTAKTETEKHDRYQKAEDKYQAALKTIKAAYAKAGVNDPKALQASEDAALAELNKDKEGIETWYAGEVHAIGGKMPNDLPDAARGQLKKGFVTTFGNGQQWTLDANGQPKQVK
jgi:hypothetical protein